jgi:predicted nucleic acid-binding protein
MHQSLLIDSDVLIDHLRKKKNALDFLSKEIEKGSFLFVSVISRNELWGRS